MNARTEPQIEALVAERDAAFADYRAYMDAVLRHPGVPPLGLVSAQDRYEHAQHSLDAAMKGIIASRFPHTITYGPKRSHRARYVVLSGIAVGVAFGLALRLRR